MMQELLSSNMLPYRASTSSESTSSSSSATKQLLPSDIDGLLAGAGYKVLSMELRQVAQRLERLETAMVKSPTELSLLASEAVLDNPSDLASWIYSLLSEFAQHESPLSLPSDLPDVPDFIHNQTPITINPPGAHDSAPHQQLTVVTTVEEDSGIRLVHTCYDPKSQLNSPH